MAKKNKRTRDPHSVWNHLWGEWLVWSETDLDAPGDWVFPKSSDKQILFRDDPQRIGSLSDLWQVPDIFVETQWWFFKGIPAFEFTWCGSAPNLHHPSDTQPLIGYTMLYSNILGYTNWFIWDHCSLFHWDTADTYWPTSIVGWHCFFKWHIYIDLSSQWQWTSQESLKHTYTGCCNSGQW